MTELNTIAFQVIPSPETNDHEVKIFVDGRDYIAQHWPAMMGMDPDDVLSYRELSPRDKPHDAIVVRCGCGIVGLAQNLIRHHRTTRWTGAAVGICNMTDAAKVE